MEEVNGILVDGNRFRVTPSFIEISSPSGAVLHHTALGDVTVFGRFGNTVRILTRSGASFELPLTSNEDALRIEALLQQSVPGVAAVPFDERRSRKRFRTDSGRALPWGCGGTIGAVLLLFLAAAGVVGMGIAIVFVGLAAISTGEDDEADRAVRPRATTVRSTTEPTATAATAGAPEPAGGASISFDVDREDEVVTISNTGDIALDVSGLTVVSVQGDERFTIPAGTVIQPGASLVIASGGATGDLTWSDQSVWDDEGDPAELVDADGNVVARDEE